MKLQTKRACDTVLPALHEKAAGESRKRWISAPLVFEPQAVILTTRSQLALLKPG
jgi:hypothetical protein